MSDDSSFFTWPMIIGCIVAYNIFFGDDDADEKSVESVDQETPAIVEVAEPDNSIDDSMQKIRDEVSKTMALTKDALIEAKKEIIKNLMM